MQPNLSRRQILQWMCATAAAAGLPLGCGKPQGAEQNPYLFFTPEEVTLYGALADTVLPEDDRSPGAGQLGAALFADQLLSAFDRGGLIWRKGPFSGRAPNLDGSTPENGFLQAIPLDRVSERAFRLYLYGSDGVEGGGPNDALLGKVAGLRDELRNGLSAAREVLGAGFEKLSLPERAAKWKTLDEPFRETVMTLVVQSMFAAPEYGGNKDRKGWEAIAFDGDSQPLGFSLWNDARGAYDEREDKPVSRADAGPDPVPLDDETRAFIQKVILALGGKVAP